MGRKSFIIFVVLLSFFFFAPGGLTQVDAKHCTAQRPGSAPALTSAVPGNRSVTLTWIEAQDPVTYYLVSYGTSKDKIEFGAPNVGRRGTTSFTVGELTNGVKYYFWIRAVNDCKPGKLSNKLPATPGTNAGTVAGKKITISKQPNLSIYKNVLAASASATPTVEVKYQAPVQMVSLQEKSEKCTTCVGWQLLAGEMLLLILFFFLANKFLFLRQIYSLVIPIAIYTIFLQIHRQCISNEFFCKYFLELDIIIFMLAAIVRKNRYLERNLAMERLFKGERRK